MAKRVAKLIETPNDATKDATAQEAPYDTKKVDFIHSFPMTLQKSTSKSTQEAPNDTSDANEQMSTNENK